MWSSDGGKEWGAYCVIPEFGHDCLHGPFVFLEQHAQLLVFMKQGLVFNDDLRIHALELGLEKFFAHDRPSVTAENT